MQRSPFPELWTRARGSDRGGQPSCRNPQKPTAGMLAAKSPTGTVSQAASATHSPWCETQGLGVAGLQSDLMERAGRGLPATGCQPLASTKLLFLSSLVLRASRAVVFLPGTRASRRTEGSVPASASAVTSAGELENVAPSQADPAPPKDQPRGEMPTFSGESPVRSSTSLSNGQRQQLCEGRQPGPGGQTAGRWAGSDSRKTTSCPTGRRPPPWVPGPSDTFSKHVGRLGLRRRAAQGENQPPTPVLSR